MAHTHLHTLVVRGHEVSCCDPVIVQHSIGHDAIALDLDAEREDLFITVAFEKPDGEIYEAAYAAVKAMPEYAGATDVWEEGQGA